MNIVIDKSDCEKVVSHLVLDSKSANIYRSKPKAKVVC